MKNLLITTLIVFAVFTSNLASAHSFFGKKLDLSTNASGKAQLGMVYVYDSDWAWSLLLGAKLSNEEFQNLPETLTAKIMSLTTNRVYKTLTVKKASVLLNRIVINDEMTLRAMLPHIKELGLVYSDSKDEALYYYPMSEACANYPTYVSNLSNTKAVACEVDPNSFKSKETQCAEQKTRLLKYISQGFLTCPAAKDMYTKLGCGELECK